MHGSFFTDFGCLVVFLYQSGLPISFRIHSLALGSHAIAPVPDSLLIFSGHYSGQHRSILACNRRYFVPDDIEICL